MTVSKLGSFRVSGEFFRNLDAGDGANLFHGMVVLRAEPEWHCGKTRYLAVHPDFEPVPEGCVPPMYEAVFGSDSIYPRWQKSEVQYA